ncbi:TetR/AcrR family transcriptional regulator [Companilactobacillus mishanensis]|uniref:TetR/AcrR family transcriptional regulator n=1 Tax=Companilactobacillus mishanensis TaxID=2486008 RepID=A0A5P0ZIC3_9LACO|nr:TetR/AcrR family transcriptional regulator [Companilactobacillus mishanensis]MQS46050.1 TetR/AcrR family transcriptional regulator [Companilactobacillus mishanensis]MQS52768.1 TetR/AcrR family transcriptional regulator [Companilactobacillus mishanensis]MQS89530.1 TetR/AcrR family transcriptional regulator [Companilactobacillus mishanensis]
MSQVTERTEKAIITAMISLLEKKPFDKITVGDICKESQINHSTFYRYFNDKFALLHAVFAFLLDDLIINSNSTETIVTQIADFIGKNNDFMRHVSPQYQTKANLYPEFRLILKDIIKRKYENTESPDDPLITMISDSETPELMISFIVGALVGVVEYLVDNDFKVPKDEFTKFTEDLFRKWS